MGGVGIGATCKKILSCTGRQPNGNATAEILPQLPSSQTLRAFFGMRGSLPGLTGAEKHTNTMELSDYKYTEGERIEMCPHTDQWMMGARFGKVVKLLDADKELYLIQLDKIRKPVRACVAHFMSAKSGHPTREV